MADLNPPPKHEQLRGLLTLKETVMLAGVREAIVRKDIEHKVISPLKTDSDRIMFRWADVYLMAALYRYEWFNKEARRSLAEKLEEAVPFRFRKDRFLTANRNISCLLHNFAPSESVKNVDLTVEFLTFPFRTIKSECAPSVDCYANGLSKIEERDGMLGGEAVFRGSRLSVLHIGKMRAQGESLEDILLDYRFLQEDDVNFADMYFRAHPAMGRPREPRGGQSEFAIG